MTWATMEKAPKDGSLVLPAWSNPYSEEVTYQASSTSTACFKALSISSGTVLKSCSSLGLSKTGAERILSFAPDSDTSISENRPSIFRK
jgi:hypothetical protein